MAVNNELRGLIYSKYRNITEMAAAMGWSRQRLHNALGKPKKLSLENAQEIACALGIALNESTIGIFLQS